jgi:hypothetical protein
MNLQSWINIMVGDPSRPAAPAGIFGQTRLGALFCSNRIMSTFIRPSLFVACVLLALAFSFKAAAQTNYYGTNGTEYAVIGSLPGDQVFPDVAISTNGGFLVWQDNATDGAGWGISARRLDPTLAGTLSTFRVNVQGVGNQENARVALLKSGGAAFVWQGGALSRQHIYARFLNSTNTFLTVNDVLVNTFTNNFQINPAIAVLSNSNLVVVWSSYNQAGSNSMQDVYGQLLTATGQKIGGEFLVNQFTVYNQRTPSVAALAGGGFVVTWVSEQQRQLSASVGNNTTYVSTNSSLIPSVDIYARLFTAAGAANGNEFLVNTDNNPCANPVAAAATDGSFLISWTVRDMANPNNSLDIFARNFSSNGVGGTAFYANTRLYGDQYIPRVSALGLDYLVTWTSLGQDSSREGVYGQFVHNDGTLKGAEFRVNTTTTGQQMQPTVTADGMNQFLVVWTSFNGLPNTFDLYAQRYLNVSALLQPMAAPFVWAPFVLSNGVYQPQLVVSWPNLAGLSILSYEVYVNGATNPIGLVSSNQWTMTAANGLMASSTNSFQLDYVLTDGRRSPLSPSAIGMTWSGLNWGGIPYEWMVQNYGSNTNLWPSATSKPVSGGPTLKQIFLSGGNPNQPSTWLQTVLTRTAQGMFLSWNTQSGASYQVQATTDLLTWTNVGSARFAAGTVDSIYVGGNSKGYYRVLLLRQ